MSNWKDRALVELVARHRFSGEAARQAVSEATDLAGTSGESPENLFGRPDGWAAEHAAAAREGLRDGGPDPFETEALPTARIFVKHALISMGVVGLFFWFFTRNEPPTLGLLLMPLLIGLCIAFNTDLGVILERRMSRRRALGISFVVMAVTAAGVALVSYWARDIAISLPGWWIPTQSAVLFGAGLAIPSGAQQSVEERRTWEERAAEELRARGDYSEDHIRRILADARDFAAASGDGVEAEFGAPHAFARSLPARPSELARRRFWTNVGWFVMLGILLGLWVFGRTERPLWWIVVGAALWVLSGILVVISAVRLRRPHAPHSSP